MKKVDLKKNVIWFILINFLLLTNLAPLKAQECTRFGLWLKCGVTYTNSLGATYIGDFKRNNPNGKGTIKYNEASKFAGDKYEGYFYDGMPHGNGVYYHQNGDIFRGTWAAGSKNGSGLRISGVKRYDELYEFGMLISSIEIEPKKQNNSINNSTKNSKTASSIPAATIDTNQVSIQSQPAPAFQERASMALKKPNPNQYIDSEESDSNEDSEYFNFLLACLTVISLLMVVMLGIKPAKKNVVKAQKDTPLMNFNADKFGPYLTRFENTNKPSPKRKILRAMTYAFDVVSDKKSIEQDGLKTSFFRSIEPEKSEKMLQKKKQKMS